LEFGFELRRQLDRRAIVIGKHGYDGPLGKGEPVQDDFPISYGASSDRHRQMVPEGLLNQRACQTQSHSQLKWRRYFGCLTMRTPRMLAAWAFVSAITSAA